jgi:hypothetical protein
MMQIFYLKFINESVVICHACKINTQRLSFY